MKKTNAMRILDSKKIPYNTYEYDVSDGKTDGLTVAAKLNQDPKMVFKTLVTKGASRDYYVFVIPVGDELNLKKAAKAAGEKKIEMISMKELLPTTGYVHGGCSPIGMKKQFKTFIDESVMDNELIICSGGKVGLQIEVRVVELLEVVGGEVAELV